MLVGRKGEDAAADWLRAKGAQILARNWKIAGGEVDLIIAERDEIAFVEVKTRLTEDAFGGGLEAIPSWKQKRIERAASAWLMGKGRAYRDRGVRFDVVVVEGQPPSRVRIQHVRDAWESTAD